MTEQEIHEIFKYISDSDEKCANEVMYALVLLSTNIKNMLESVKKQIITQVGGNKFDELNRLTKFCNNITELNNQVEESIDILIKQSGNAKKASDEITPIVESKRDTVSATVDYSQYAVSSREKHTLDEDFEYSKIIKFEFKGQGFIVHSWKEMLCILCAKLYAISPTTMESFCQQEEFIQKRISYFSHTIVYDMEGRPRNEKVKDSKSLYVWTNLSSNRIVELIKKILKAYGYKKEDVVLYLRADYKKLHE